MRQMNRPGWKKFHLLAAVCGLSLMAGCGSNPPAPVSEQGRLTQIERHGGAAASAGAIPVAATPVSLPSGYYLVKKGDTLYSISLDHGQSYRDVAAWNNLEDPNKIQAGQQLRVVPPATAATEVKPVTAPAAVEARSLEKSGDLEPLKREPKGGRFPYTPETLAQLQKPDVVTTSSVVATASDSKAEVAKSTEKAAAEKNSGDKAAIKPVVKPASAASAPGDSALEWDWPARGKLLNGFVEGSSKGLDISGKAGEPVFAAAAGKVTLVSNALRGYGNLVVIKHNDIYLSVYAHNSRILVKEEQIVAKGQKIAEIGSSDSDQAKLHFEIRRQGKPVDPAKFLPAR